MAKSKSSMNIVPVLLILILILGAGYLLLKDTLKLPWFRNDNTIEITRLEGFPRSWNTQKDIKKSRIVIKSESELRDFFTNVDMDDDTSLQAIIKAVNFETEYLLAVNNGVQEETEGLLRIKRVERDDSKKRLTIKVYQYKPDATCVPEINKNVLIDIVKISKSDYEVKFEIITENRSCD
jgi:hypothetical protein